MVKANELGQGQEKRDNVEAMRGAGGRGKIT